MTLIIGNIIALIASLLMVYSGIIKEKKKILIVQDIQMILLAISNAVLGGITGCIINAIGVVRNTLCYYDKFNIIEKIIIILLSVGLTLLFNNMGIIGIFPLISIVVYTLFMTTKKILYFKYLIIFTMVMWAIYDITIRNYVAFIFDIFTIITNIIAIFSIRKK